MDADRPVFTTEEVALEERRMARERYRRQLGKVVLFGGLGLLSALNLAMFMVHADALWPVWVDAMAAIPGPARLHWRFITASFAFWAVVGPLAAAYYFRKRHPPDDEEWTMRAMRRLTWRGGLSGEDD